MKTAALIIVSFIAGFTFAVLLAYAITQPLATTQKTSAVKAKACYRVMT